LLILSRQKAVIPFHKPIYVIRRSYAVLVLIPLLACALSAAHAQNFRAYAGEFLQLGVGARSLALGGAGVAISEDVTSGYWNPAGLARLNYPGVAGMHEARFDNTVQYNYGAIALPIGKTASVALSVLQVGIDNIKDTRSAWIDLNRDGHFNGDDYIDYTKVTSFGNHDWGFLLSYANLWNPDISYGVTAKVILRKLDNENSATGFGFDVGLQYRAMDRLTLGFLGQDITTTLLSYTSGVKELVSPTLKFGGAYQIFLVDDGYHKIIPTLDMDLRFENRGTVAEAHLGPMSADFHFGAEYQFGQLFAIRAGYSDLKQFSIGAGVKLPKLSLDYTFLSFNGQDQLGNTHRISFQFSLQQDRWKREGS
jgi:hypothetical protein